MTTMTEELKAQGLEQGLVRARRQNLERLMTLKFGPLSDAVSARIQGADLEVLDCWLERIFSADTPDAAIEGVVEIEQP